MLAPPPPIPVPLRADGDGTIPSGISLTIAVSAGLVGIRSLTS